MDHNDIPEEFICPITKDVMMYPFTTSVGNSYEYAAVVEWLKKRKLDPLSGVQLKDTGVYPNNTLRSQILSWFQDHPDVKFNIQGAVKPPAAAYNKAPKFIPLPQQDKVLKYHTKTSRVEEQKQEKAKVPESFYARNHKYTFSSTVNGHNRTVLSVQCDNGPLIEMPDKEMFVTAQGITFYDPSTIRDARVLPDTDFKELCKFGIKCTNSSCKFAHPFVCPKGVACYPKCKHLHPDNSSVVPIGKQYPLTVECKYHTSCSNSTCMFAHPHGRLTVPRHPARIFITHSLTLEELANPIQMKLEVPEKATCFQFQGEFVFFFVPYSGTWAKGHYQHVMAYRFDAYNGLYKAVGTYSLDKHYCNSVAGSGRYMVISFWPYEEEAIRTVWESLRVARTMEKEIRKLKSELKEKDTLISKLKGSIAHHRAQLNNARKEGYKAREELRSVLAEQRAKEMAWRKKRQDYERQRMNRFRLRDPIHIYALQTGCSGFAKEDWKLVLDYHKGAHDLTLRKPNNFGIQRLEITEHDTVYHFDLVVPADIRLLGKIPLVPARLCGEF